MIRKVKKLGLGRLVWLWVCLFLMIWILIARLKDIVVDGFICLCWFWILYWFRLFANNDNSNFMALVICLLIKVVVFDSVHDLVEVFQ